jgi:hypothetical protein
MLLIFKRVIFGRCRTKIDNLARKKLHKKVCCSPFFLKVLNILHNHWLVWFMVSNANFNNISVILWQSVLLVEETGVPGENH